MDTYLVPGELHWSEVFSQKRSCAFYGSLRRWDLSPSLELTPTTLTDAKPWLFFFFFGSVSPHRIISNKLITYFPSLHLHPSVLQSFVFSVTFVPASVSKLCSSVSLGTCICVFLFHSFMFLWFVVSEDDVFYDKLPSFERLCGTPAGMVLAGRYLDT